MSRPVFGVPELSLRFENTEECSHCGRVGRILELLANLPRGRAPQAVDHVHDLAFTPRECGLPSCHRTKTYLSCRNTATTVTTRPAPPPQRPPPREMGTDLHREDRRALTPRR